MQVVAGFFQRIYQLFVNSIQCVIYTAIMPHKVLILDVYIFSDAAKNGYHYCKPPSAYGSCAASPTSLIVTRFAKRGLPHTFNSINLKPIN